MASINRDTQEYLRNKARVRKLTTNEYLKDQSNPNYIYIMDRFFDNVSSKAQRLNTGCGIARSISTIVANYTDEPLLELPIRKSIVDYVTFWEGAYEYRQVDGKLEIGYAPVSKQYQTSDGVNHILWVYEDTEYDTNNKEFTYYYAFIRSYYTGKTENHLYLLSAKDDLSSMKEVNLNTIPITAEYKTTEITGLDRPALVVVKEDRYDQEPRGDIMEIEEMIYALDRNIVMTQTQLLQNVESFILTKNINRPAKVLAKYNNGFKIDFSELGRVVNGWDDSDIKFINNINELLKESIAYEDNQIRRMSATISVPTDFLWLESAHGGIGKGSRGILHGAFTKKIENIRSVFDKFLKPTQELLAKRNGDEYIEYTRPDVFAKTDTELVTEMKLAVESQPQLISQSNAIKQYQNISDEQVEKEMKTIREEKTEAIEAIQSLQPNPVDEGNNNGQPTSKDKESNWKDTPLDTNK